MAAAEDELDAFLAEVHHALAAAGPLSEKARTAVPTGRVADRSGCVGHGPADVRHPASLVCAFSVDVQLVGTLLGTARP